MNSSVMSWRSGSINETSSKPRLLSFIAVITG